MPATIQVRVIAPTKKMTKNTKGTITQAREMPLFQPGRRNSIVAPNGPSS